MNWRMKESLQTFTDSTLSFYYCIITAWNVARSCWVWGGRLYGRGRADWVGSGKCAGLGWWGNNVVWVHSSTSHKNENIWELLTQIGYMTWYLFKCSWNFAHLKSTSQLFCRTCELLAGAILFQLVWKSKEARNCILTSFMFVSLFITRAKSLNFFFFPFINDIWTKRPVCVTLPGLVGSQ